MTESLHFLETHGVAILFGAVLLEQLGVPLPATPWLLAGGALAKAGKFNLSNGVIVTVLACAIADALWFYLGRFRGNQVLGFLCRVSLEPDSCVRRTQNLFTRYGMPGLIVAKFVPGLSLMAPPLAGMAGMSAPRFLFVDSFASFLYAVIFIGLGFIFGTQIHEIVDAISNLGGNALGLLAALAAIYIGFKYWRRRRLLRELQMARITVAELRQKQTAGESLLILDLRSRLDLEQDPSVIVGAIHFAVDEIERRLKEIPLDREIIVYCACPNEITSAKAALMLRRKGISRVRPLLGGIDAWRANQYPLELFKADARTQSSLSPAL